MPVQGIEGGGWVATGKSIDYVRLITLRGRLRLEILGIKFRGRPTSVIIRKEFGWVDRERRALLQRLEEYIESVKEEWNAPHP